MSEATFESLVKSMEDLTEAIPRFFGCLYGPMGAGKTTLAFQTMNRILPPDKKIAYFDTHQGWVSIRNEANFEEIKNRTTRWQWKGISQLEAFATACEQKRPGFENFGGVIYDEASWMTWLSLDKLTRMRAKTDKGKDPDEPKWPDMNAVQHIWLNMQEALIRSKLHYIYCAHERFDTVRGVEKASPDFLPKLIGKVCQPMHLVGYVNAVLLEAAETEAVYSHLVQVHPSRSITAKTRLKHLPVEVDHPTLINAVEKFVETGELLPDNELPDEITLPTEFDKDAGDDPAILVD